MDQFIYSMGMLALVVLLLGGIGNWISENRSRIDRPDSGHPVDTIEAETHSEFWPLFLSVVYDLPANT